MNAVTLVIRELTYRKGNALLGVLAVCIAVSVVLGATGILRAFDSRTEQVVADKEAEVGKQTALLQEEYRKIGTSMGFNVLIMPREQDLGDLYASDFATHFMPESYVDTLAHSELVTIRHLLPTIQQKITWPERKRTIILTGTRGEVPVEGEVEKKSLLDPVPEGEIILGYELADGYGLKKGATVRIMGRAFTVRGTYPQRGTKDDITVWVNLRTAQQMIGREGLISGIMALECNCAMGQIGMVREEIGRLLPNTQVIEFASKALTRAESRKKAAEYAQKALESERAGRAAMRAEKERLVSLVVPLVVAAAAVWVGLLALLNLRERRSEVGILRAVGRTTGFVLTLFVGRALAIGLAGGALGLGLGAVILAVQEPRMTVDAASVLMALGARHFCRSSQPGCRRLPPHSRILRWY